MSVIEEDVVKKRVLARETALKKLTKRFLQWSSVALSTSSEENQSHYHAVTRELALYSFAVNKTAVVIDTSTQDALAYESNADQLGTTLADARAEVEALKQTLEQEKLHRQHLEEYDNFARIVNELPSRADMQREIDSAAAEVAELAAKNDSLAAQIDMRNKQFHLLLSAVQELQQTLKDDDIAALREQQKQRQQQQQQQQDAMSLEPQPAVDSADAMETS